MRRTTQTPRTPPWNPSTPPNPGAGPLTGPDDAKKHLKILRLILCSCIINLLFLEADRFMNKATFQNV